MRMVIFTYESADHAPEFLIISREKRFRYLELRQTAKLNPNPIAEPFSYRTKYINSQKCPVPSSTSHAHSHLKETPFVVMKFIRERSRNSDPLSSQGIQTESATFKPDFWYPMNGRTTFQPVATADEVVDFGVPSGKAPGVKLISKI